eukprot:TRINITY_DN31852_c0_g1_i1.p1 TRINITY_DN31852_c0_g1~~TRINITY_DN31852_c0_g1_i1.p1  ORF type:complete len:138 (+),score=15.78 TRINITY_DN31852_c0_g1_i1:63-476(+)
MSGAPFRSRGIEWIYVMMSKGIRGAGAPATLRVDLRGRGVVTGSDLLELIINNMSENVQKVANENRDNLRLHYCNNPISLTELIEYTPIVTACSVTLILFEEKYLVPPPPDSPLSSSSSSSSSSGESLYSDGTAISL